MALSGGSSHAQRLAAIQASDQQQQALQLQQQAAETQQQALDQANSLQQQQLKSAQDAASVASTNRIASIQQSVSADTWSLLKQFGQRAAIAGSSLAVPLSTATGGFAQAPATASGAPR